MPSKSVITLSELVLLLLVWGACQSVWRAVIVQGLTVAVQGAFPRLDQYRQTVVAASVLALVLYALVLFTRNIDIGRYKVFELVDV